MPPEDVERDYDAERQAIADLWEAAAAGWGRQHATWGDQSGPVADWLIAALELTPGQRLLELAGGTGEVGFRALPLIMPGGTLITSDQAEAMVEVARSRAQELGLEGIEFRVLNGEWLDLEVASVDAVVCRWGYMLMADPSAALRETRRVLRSGGRVSLAVWDERELNPWSAIPNRVLAEHGLIEPPTPGEPGPFSLADTGRLREMLEEAGFGEIRLGSVDIARRAPDFDSWWATQLDLSVSTRRAFEKADEEQTIAVEAEVAERFAPFTDASGALAVPGRTHVAVAEA
ncbi:MAG: class I SAM-dependent methyltransferase [Solirubrobacteraceae bacterium]